jgi:hypothetical protein
MEEEIRIPWEWVEAANAHLGVVTLPDGYHEGVDDAIKAIRALEAAGQDAFEDTGDEGDQDAAVIAGQIARHLESIFERQ